MRSHALDPDPDPSALSCVSQVGAAQANATTAHSSVCRSLMIL